MSMVCPQCNGLFDQHMQCPTCSARLFNQAVSHATPAPALPAQGELWQHTALGRLLVGLVLAQGLAYVLRMLCHAGLLLTGAEPQAFWSAMTGMVLLQGMQGVGLLVGGGVAGAGQPRGALLGGAVGLVNGFVSVIIQHLLGEPVTEVLLYGQPVLHLAFGALGGLAGMLIWKPLPALALASPPGGGKKGPRARRPHPILAAPVAWFRVLLGATIVLGGVFWPKVLLDFILGASQGRMGLTSHMQAELVTWEVSGLVVLLGAAAAGFGTFSGLKQGLCVAAVSALFFVAIRLGTGRMPAAGATVLTLLGILLLSAVGGWFGGQLFPPVVSTGRKGDRVRLSRLEG